MSPSVPKNFKYSSTAAAGCFVSIMICLKRGREKAWPRKRRAKLLRIRFKYVWDPTQRLFRRSPLKLVRGRRVPIGPSCSKSLRTTACPKAIRVSRLKLAELKSSTLCGSFMSRWCGCGQGECPGCFTDGHCGRRVSWIRARWDQRSGKIRGTVDESALGESECSFHFPSHTDGAFSSDGIHYPGDRSAHCFLRFGAKNPRFCFVGCGRTCNGWFHSH